MAESEGTATQVRLQDGTEIAALEFGEASTGRLSLLFWPALGVPLGYYQALLTQWSERGRHVVAVEQRGMPLSPVASVRDADFGYSTILREDLPAVADRFFSDSRPYAAVGHSLGGQLALLATGSGVIRPRATTAIASGTSSPAAKSTTWGRMGRRGQVTFIRATSALLGYWPGDRLGFGGKQPRRLMRDWCTEGRLGRYLLHGDDEDYEAGLRAIRQPVLLASLHGDSVITERAATDLANRLPDHAEHRRLSHSTGEAFDHIR